MLIVNHYIICNNFHDVDSGIIGPKDYDTFVRDFTNTRNDLVLAVHIDEYRLAHPVNRPLNPDFIRARLEGDGLNPGDNHLRVLAFYPPENSHTKSDGELMDYLIDTTRVQQNLPGRRPWLSLATKAPMIGVFDVESWGPLDEIEFEQETVIVGQQGDPDALAWFSHGGNL